MRLTTIESPHKNVSRTLNLQNDKFAIIATNNEAEIYDTKTNELINIIALPVDLNTETF